MTSVQTAKRIGRGTLKPGNWIQLLQFGLVGASGYIVNLASPCAVEPVQIQTMIGSGSSFTPKRSYTSFCTRCASAQTCSPVAWPWLTSTSAC